MNQARRSSQLNGFFRERASDKELWDQVIELFSPIDEIYNNGRFGSNATPSIEEVRAALVPHLTAGDAFDGYVIGNETFFELDLEGLEDLTDVLHASSLKADIPPNHLFMGLAYGFGDIFLNPPKKSVGTALERLVGHPDKPERVEKLIKLLNYNFGGVWMHILWHAFKGRREQVQQLTPLMQLMPKSPIVGRNRTTGQWLILAV